MNESNALATSGDSHVFSGIQAFDAAQRMARALSSSALVPKIYQGQTGLANSLIALELANRMGISPLTVMQNMTPINGRPSWSSSFLIGTVNACGRFSPLRFIFDDIDNPTSCYAEANDLATGEVLRGEKITIAMAKAEGWYGRSGSKWPTMPGQMLRYRAGAFWARAYCPEISLGIVTKEEAIDVEQVEVSVAEPVQAVEKPAPSVIEAQEVADAPSEVFIGIMDSVAAAPDSAPWAKSLERAKQLLSEGTINDREHTEIEAAIQRRIQQAEAAATHDAGENEGVDGHAGAAVHDPTAGGGAAPDSSASAHPADGGDGQAANAQGEAADAGEPAAPPAEHDPSGDPIPAAGDSPAEPAASPDLKLRDRQQLIRAVNSCAPERRSVILASLKERFGIDSTAQLKTQEHSDFVVNFLKEGGE